MEIHSTGTQPPALVAERTIHLATARAHDAGAEERTSAATAPQGPERVASEEDIARSLTSINDILKLRSPDLEFSVDKESNRSIVKVIDKNTHEVIRQMPTQEALEIAKALDRLQSFLIKATA